MPSRTAEQKSLHPPQHAPSDEQRKAGTSENPDLLRVDWSKIPAPEDDGAAAHLPGLKLASIALPATDASTVDLARLPGRTIVFAYPRTGVPGQPSVVADWDMIPGARGCTPQACSFRDLFQDLKSAGATHVYGLSTQHVAYQTEAATRLHLPFPLLSDADLAFMKAARLPAMNVGGQVLLKRLSMIIDDGVISAVDYPVFPPDQNAARVLAWLLARPL
ncbi:MAG: peroxiredoxin [Hyphomicrobiaceae bacterium]